MNRNRVEEIARSKTNLSASEVSQMDTEGLWREIYACAPPKKTPDNRPTFFPTGFAKAERDSLIVEAEGLGFRKTGDVNRLTDFVVTGDSPGAGRLEKASRNGCTVLTAAQFLAFARHGVIDASDEDARTALL
jgi:NAD-dependent DNA ligase